MCDKPVIEMTVLRGEQLELQVHVNTNGINVHQRLSSALATTLKQECVDIDPLVKHLTEATNDENTTAESHYSGFTVRFERMTYLEAHSRSSKAA